MEDRYQVPHVQTANDWTLLKPVTYYSWPGTLRATEAFSSTLCIFSLHLNYATHIYNRFKTILNFIIEIKPDFEVHVYSLMLSTHYL